MHFRVDQTLNCPDRGFLENGKRMIYPARIKEFKSFQRMFARNIREQGWLENGVKEDD